MHLVGNHDFDINTFQQKHLFTNKSLGGKWENV